MVTWADQAPCLSLSDCSGAALVCVGCGSVGRGGAGAGSSWRCVGAWGRCCSPADVQMGDHSFGDCGMDGLGCGGTFQLKKTKSSSPDGSVMMRGSGSARCRSYGSLSCMCSSYGTLVQSL